MTPPLEGAPRLEIAEEAKPSRQLATAAAATRIAIVGVPNSGKSTLFHQLTGKYTPIANYPYTTLELIQASVTREGRELVLIDTPGITGLEPGSEDEAPTHALLHDQPPEVLVQVVDAGNLQRSLVLTSQLADLEIPLVVCLNMVDEAWAHGLLIDAEQLARELGVPVVATCAADGRGVTKVAADLPRAQNPRQVTYPPALEAKLDALGSGGSRAHTVLQLLSRGHEDLLPGQDLRHMCLEAHLHWAREVAARVSRSSGLEPERSSWDRLTPLALHPLGSWLLLLLAAFLVYFLVAKVGVDLLANNLERGVVAPAIALVAGWTGPGLLQEILVGPYGLISLGVLNAICTVLPILTVFYLLFGFLEDIGYFPLLAVQFDRLLRFTGLTGKAILPITLGFGCNSVATMATRTLETPRQRFIACFIIALSIPCAVQLGVMVAILSAVPFWVPAGMVLTVVLLQLLTGMALSRFLPRSERGELLLELPPLRRPGARNILRKTAHRLHEFFRETLPLFVASAGVLLLLHYTGLLAALRDLMAPLVVRGLGLPATFADCLLMTLARREVGAVMIKQLADAGMLDHRQIFIGLLVMTLFVPCMSNTLIMARVLGWLRTAFIFLAVTAIALGAGLAFNAAL